MRYVRRTLAGMWFTVVITSTSLCCGQGSKPTDLEIAYRHAPIHHQDVDVTGESGLMGRADYITAVDFDNDWDTTNNWENAESHELSACCYYSVVESATHWFVVYAFFHPRDWSDIPVIGGLDEHENDLEGCLAIVRRPTPGDDPKWGEIEGLVTVFHRDLFTYVTTDSPFLEGEEDIDGELTLQEFDGSRHPVTAQEAKGHGLKAWPYVKIEGGDGVIYVPSRSESEEPSSPNDREVMYRLVDIFAEGGLWSRQDDMETFSTWGIFAGDDGKNNAAHAPWRWDDHDDDSHLTGGELALDPVRLTMIYFSDLGDFSREYLRNEYQQIQVVSENDAVQTPNSLSLTPTHVKGDADFSGHGPLVDVSVDVRVIGDGTLLEARVSISAQEWENDKPRADFTTVEAQSQWQAILSVAPGRSIQVGEELSAELRYVDDNHEEDHFLRAIDGPVQRFICIGDTRGEEAGTKTMVEVLFHPVVVK